MSELRPDLPQVEVHSRSGWRAWLTDHHRDSTGVWAVTREPGSGWSRVNKERIAETAELAARNERANQWPRR